MLNYDFSLSMCSFHAAAVPRCDPQETSSASHAAEMSELLLVLGATAPGSPGGGAAIKHGSPELVVHYGIRC